MTWNGRSSKPIQSSKQRRLFQKRKAQSLSLNLKIKPACVPHQKIKDRAQHALPTVKKGLKMCDLTALYRLNLPHRAISVYLYLSARANGAGICWPSIPTISKDLKLSESTVHRAIIDLRKANLISTQQRYRENGGYSSQLFMLCMDGKTKP